MGRWRRAGGPVMSIEATRAQIRAARPDRIELGLGQCGSGKTRADRPGGAAPARRHDPQRIPLPHLYQGRGRRDAEPAVPHARDLGDAGGRAARRRARRAPDPEAPPHRDLDRRARCSPARSRRRAGSKSRRSTPSATRCCAASPLEGGVAPLFTVLEDRQARAFARRGARPDRRERAGRFSPPSPRI